MKGAASSAGEVLRIVLSVCQTICRSFIIRDQGPLCHTSAKNLKFSAAVIQCKDMFREYHTDFLPELNSSS